MIVGIILSIIVLAPFILVVINSAKISTQITSNPLSLPTNWGQMFTNMHSVATNSNFPYWRAFGNSMFITIVSLILLTFFSSMAAWVLCRNNKKNWSAAIYMLFVAAMVIPFQVVMLPILAVFRGITVFTGVPMLKSYFGIIFAYMGFGGSMTIFILHGFIKGIPYELEEAAWIDGCLPEQTFFKVIFPLLRPVQMTVLILNGLWIWNDFLLPLLMVNSNNKTKTLVLAAYTFVGQMNTKWNYALTAMVLTVVPSIIVFILLQKYIVEGVVAGAVKG